MKQILNFDYYIETIINWFLEIECKINNMIDK